MWRDRDSKRFQDLYRLSSFYRLNSADDNRIRVLIDSSASRAPFHPLDLGQAADPISRDPLAVGFKDDLMVVDWNGEVTTAGVFVRRCPDDLPVSVLYLHLAAADTNA